MTKIAIIGSTSFLASYLIADLEEENHELTLFSRQKTTENHQFISFSFPDSIPDLGVFLEFDVIVFAAAGGVQSSKKYSLDEIYQLNAFLPITIANFLDANNFKGKFITFGSYFEIGAQESLKKFSEKEVALSDYDVPNHYCLSKRLLTRFVNDSLAKIDHYHVILPSIYGKNENQNRLIPYLIESLEYKKELELTAGTQIRQFLHIKDVCSFIMMLCHKNVEKGIYNLASDTQNLVKDVVELIFKHFNKDHNNALGKAKRQDESMQVILLDNKKAKDLGWNPTISLEEGILDYFKKESK
ncbi:NAD-dependent epimerase/dehydratase family protein [Flavobacterium yafengii]|uniref:NAD-dependent epimerase/dehydratase family protein n=1 Tax=Flavobacterium yafengii TaxID=3041253 RepID=UPI0024A9483A|nr:NAD(P)-dependent oxidoreductase [Flavobacterium yafengii]MDI5887459.1 NAD(P)-dependent oxidoreductase [Flavobacterium yafengii]